MGYIVIIVDLKKKLEKALSRYVSLQGEYIFLNPAVIRYINCTFWASAFARVQRGVWIWVWNRAQRRSRVVQTGAVSTEHNTDSHQHSSFY